MWAKFAVGLRLDQGDFSLYGPAFLSSTFPYPG